MVGLLRIILIIVIVYYLIRILNRFVIPYLFGTKTNKDNSYNDQAKSSFTHRSKKGNVTITGSAEKQKRFNKDEGEYVDYEEVE